MGIVPVVLGFISYQMKTSRNLLIFQLATAFAFSAHYLLIGAYTAAALNLLGTVSFVFYYLRDKRGDKSLIEPIVFILLVLITGVLTWDNGYSAFLLCGLVVNTLSLTLGNAQKTRVCMFIKSPLCLIYNILVSSVCGIIYECAVLTSSFIGIIKNRRKK